MVDPDKKNGKPQDQSMLNTAKHWAGLCGLVLIVFLVVLVIALAIGANPIWGSLLALIITFITSAITKARTTKEVFDDIIRSIEETILKIFSLIQRFIRALAAKYVKWLLSVLLRMYDTVKKRP